MRSAILRNPRPIALEQVRYQIVVCKGGLDLITPTLSLPPGFLRDALNFECAVTGGYTRVGGYERFDGRTKPSSATYGIVQVASFTNVPAVGDVITQATSAATGKVIVVGADYMVVTKVTGTFDTTHSITTPGPIAIGTAVPATVSPTSLQNAQWLNAAADVYRADIAAVPGQGPIRGVVGFTVSGNDVVYAFRDNVGATAVDIYKSTTSGWSKVTLLNEVSFTAGAVLTALDGETLTQGGVTATVKRVMAQTGATPWGGDAAGRFIITNPAGGGGHFAAGAATLSGGATCTLSGAETAITITTGGKYEFDQGNFAGQSGTIRIYGCDGVNRCFEFDGTTYAPITTGINPDTPKHIRIHKNYLHVSVQSSSFNSATGSPYRWDSINGAAELPVGDTITGYLVLPGDQTTGSMAIFAKQNLSFLYGNTSASWNLVAYNRGIGGIEYSLQNMNDGYFLDDRGVTTLKQTLNFGNFDAATLTTQIRPFIMEKKTRVSYSCLMREKNQYRIFFNDGYAVFLTIINGKYLGAIPVLFPNAINCAWNGTLTTGLEATYLGASSSGFVYQADSGSSFDGGDVDAYLTMAWDSVGSPRILKRFRESSIEMSGSFYAQIQFGYLLGYASPEIEQASLATYPSGFAGAPKWDAFTWDNFFWDGITLSPTDVDVTGTAENIQIMIKSGTDYIYPYTVNSLIHHYTPRRGIR